MVRHLIAILVLAVGTQLAAAQDDGAAAIADRLRDLDERLESVIESNTHVLWASIIVAGIAVLATVVYSVQLERQIRDSKKQLALSEKDVRQRLLPELAWRVVGGKNPIGASDAGSFPACLTIRVINAGQVSAGDIVVRHNARIVGVGAPAAPKMIRLGALSPGESVDVDIPMSAEDLASAMGGGVAYVEATFTYRGGGEGGLEYVVAGYRSSTISTLFGGADVAPPDGGGGRPAADADARRHALQSAGSQARLLAESGQRAGMTMEEAARRLAECDAAAGEDSASAAAHMGRAEALRAMGQNSEALKAIEAAERIRPRDAAALMEMSKILRALGRPHEAIGALGRVSGGRIDSLPVLREMARLHVLLDEHDAALALWERIAGLDPGHEAFMGMAHACMAMRRHAAAAAALARAIEARPEDALAHAQKGMAELGDERSAEAEATFRAAISLDGGLSDARVGLAHALYRLGREAEAADELDRAVESDPDNQKAHIDRGVLMLEMGRPAEAHESFAAARRLDPSMLVPLVEDGSGAHGP